MLEQRIEQSLFFNRVLTSIGNDNEYCCQVCRDVNFRGAIKKYAIGTYICTGCLGNVTVQDVRNIRKLFERDLKLVDKFINEI